MTLVKSLVVGLASTWGHQGAGEGIDLMGSSGQQCQRGAATTVQHHPAAAHSSRQLTRGERSPHQQQNKRQQTHTRQWQSAPQQPGHNTTMPCRQRTFGVMAYSKPCAAR